MHTSKLKKSNLRSFNPKTSASPELFRDWRSRQTQSTPTSSYRLILLTSRIRKRKQPQPNSVTSSAKHLLRSMIRANKPSRKLQLAKLYKPSPTTSINNREESLMKTLKSLKINNRDSRRKERRWNFLKLSSRASVTDWTTTRKN